MSVAILLHDISPTDFIRDIKEAIIPDLKKELSQEFQPKEPTEYLTNSEVCKLLKKDLSTIHRWRKKGTLTAYFIEDSIYFKRSEIEGLIEKNKLK